MVIDFEHHYIPVELGRRLGMNMDNKVAVRQGDAAVHAQLFDIEAQLRDMYRAGIDVGRDATQPAKSQLVPARHGVRVARRGRSERSADPGLCAGRLRHRDGGRFPEG